MDRGLETPMVRFIWYGQGSIISLGNNLRHPTVSQPSSPGLLHGLESIHLTIAEPARVAIGVVGARSSAPVEDRDCGLRFCRRSSAEFLAPPGP